MSVLKCMAMVCGIGIYLQMLDCGSVYGESLSQSASKSSVIEGVSRVGDAQKIRHASTGRIDPEGARSFILDGVETVASGEHPGKMVLYGSTAHALNNFHGSSGYDPMIGVASLGKGRIIAVPDHQMLNVDRYGSVGDTARFIQNGIAWLGQASASDVRVMALNRKHYVWLKEHGYPDVVCPKVASFKEDLLRTDVVFAGWLGSNFKEKNDPLLIEFVKNGGGLFIADYGEGYEMWWGKPIAEAPANRLLREAGIGFCAGGHHDTGAIVATNRPPPDLSLQAIQDMAVGSGSFTEEQRLIGQEMLARMMTALTPSELRKVLEKDASFGFPGRCAPTPANPVSDPVGKAWANYEGKKIEKIPPAEVTAHETAEELYGPVPKDAPRVSGSVKINGNRPRWHATGFYAPPGELVKIKVPDALVGKGYRIRVNAHESRISPRTSWERMPNVHRSFEIKENKVDVANAFGGSIFVDLGGRTFDQKSPGLGDVEVHVTGAIRQPWFDLDRHTDHEWNNLLRNQPAPYGVLASSNFVCVLTKKDIEDADLREPARLMKWWCRVIELQDELAARLKPRTSAEMVNVDVQIGYGAAYAGYPVQAYDKHWDNLADVDVLTEQGSWGNFHELGHNHQRPWWTFDGDTEVTVNVFSTYCMRLLSSTSNEKGWRWTINPEEIRIRANKLTSEKTYTTMESVADRLVFWIQLADEFGWEVYRTAFEGYERDAAQHPDRLPATNQEKMDQWCLRFSNAAGHNLYGFMHDVWGIPISSKVNDQLKSLPDWVLSPSESAL